MAPLNSTWMVESFVVRQEIANNASGPGLQVVCAWPVSGQYGPGSRVLYYVLVAACVFARRAEWLRNACLAAALLFPAVASLHGITLAALHVDDAIDMDVFGAFQLCSLGILAAPVTARLSRTYFNDPGRNLIFLWTILILAGQLSLTVEFFRTYTTSCTLGDDNGPISKSIGNFPYGTSCGMRCSIDDGPFSPMRRGAANNIYVIPAPDKLTFGTITLLAAACCIPAILSLISMWNKILEINWRARFSDDFMDEPIEGTNGATRGKMNNINRWIKMWLSAIEAPLFGAAIMAILVMGERNFFSPQMRYQTEPIASIGQWAPIVGTGLAVLGSLYVALAKMLAKTEDNLGDMRSSHSCNGDMQEIRRCPNTSGSSISATGSVDSARHTLGLTNYRTVSNELVPTISRPILSLGGYSIEDRGRRRKVAEMLTTVANYLGTAGQGQFDDSEFRDGEASDYPQIPGEEQRNNRLLQIMEQYNPSRDENGNRTPMSRSQLSRAGSIVGAEGRIFESITPASPVSPSSPRSVSPRPTYQTALHENGTPLQQRDSASEIPAHPLDGTERVRRDTLEVPPRAVLSPRRVSSLSVNTKTATQTIEDVSGIVSSPNSCNSTDRHV